MDPFCLLQQPLWICAKARLVGHCGWGPGQLQAELEEAHLGNLFQVPLIKTTGSCKWDIRPYKADVGLYWRSFGFWVHISHKSLGFRKHFKGIIEFVYRGLG